MILVSACLAWLNCRFDWWSCSNQKIIDMVKSWQAIPVCPELLWWLYTPRMPCERRWDRIVSRTWEDMTEQYLNWALEAFEVAKERWCKRAILKSKSPSCWCGLIFDGLFSWRLTRWDWIFTQILKENGIKVENELNFWQ
ncbi:MAG: hypothetical protein ACD_3C00225G0005 [uncultured bacterium (gcode 4)]|uniref:Uncharacterized protein n=1 Tax=uncultured bacterium (gcode 4) TaxID=1234023 RepID=K2FZE8_9BACT|nr:MAG: hypothetical protein ACD_3C00225G0005 [uncultured bacterium (gcode 4)]